LMIVLYLQLIYDKNLFFKVSRGQKCAATSNFLDRNVFCINHYPSKSYGRN